jgi:hypothetical protein
VNDRFVECLVEAFEVRNVQRAHGLDRHAERFIGATVLSHGLSRGPQDPENLRPIKPLPFTMLAKAHSVSLPLLIPATQVRCASAHRAYTGLDDVPLESALRTG